LTLLKPKSHICVLLSCITTCINIQRLPLYYLPAAITLNVFCQLPLSPGHFKSLPAIDACIWQCYNMGVPLQYSLWVQYCHMTKTNERNACVHGLPFRAYHSTSHILIRFYVNTLSLYTKTESQPGLNLVQDWWIKKRGGTGL
jgi:hypothetical protein